MRTGSETTNIFVGKAVSFSVVFTWTRATDRAEGGIVDLLSTRVFGDGWG